MWQERVRMVGWVWLVEFDRNIQYSYVKEKKCHPICTTWQWSKPLLAKAYEHFILCIYLACFPHTLIRFSYDVLQCWNAIMTLAHFESVAINNLIIFKWVKIQVFIALFPKTNIRTREVQRRAFYSCSKQSDMHHKTKKATGACWRCKSFKWYSNYHHSTHHNSFWKDSFIGN